MSSISTPNGPSPPRNHTDLPSSGPSRCFPFWQEVLACYVVNTNSEDDSGKKKCVPVLEDYYECMHHKKEVGRPPRGRSLVGASVANALGFPGRSGDGIASSIQESRTEQRPGESTDSRPNTESGTAGQGGRHQESAGVRLISGRSVFTMRLVMGRSLWNKSHKFASCSRVASVTKSDDAEICVPTFRAQGWRRFVVGMPS